MYQYIKYHTKRILVLVWVAAQLAACAVTPKPGPDSLPRPAKPGGYYLDDGPEEKPPAGLQNVPDAQPKYEALHKYANKPYSVLGQTYIPLAEGEPYKARGRASWYGKKFHGLKTASGEIYDMYAMTAAHPVLPIPSYVRVTHLNNGKSVVVRVNDRGPFLNNRIIDLSYTAAYKLGLLQAGSGPVEVEKINVLGAEISASRSGTYLQLGAFRSQTSIDTLLANIKEAFPAYSALLRTLEKDGIMRVQLGPFPTREVAREAAGLMEQHLGFPVLIVDN